MQRLPHSSLIIGVATATAERVQLARLLGGANALLLVSNAEQAREFLELAGSPEPVSAVLRPEVRVDVDEADGPQAETVNDAGEPQPEPVVEPVPALDLDPDRRVVRWQDREVSLTRLEHDFLRCLVTEPGQVWTHQRLHLAVWGNEHLGHGSHIHSVVKRLRRKLSDLGAAVTIHAVRGVGFHLPPITDNQVAPAG
jgi:DNA-binding response OmpR family regulator